jgi:hypothetical protein
MARIYFVECDSGCAHIHDAEKDKFEREVADAIAGKRHCNVLLMRPGRHVVALDVPDPPPPVPVQSVTLPNVPPKPPARPKPVAEKLAEKHRDDKP